MGGKIKLEIIEDNFAGSHHSQNELSVLIGMDSLSYCIIDAQQRVLLLRDYDLASFPDPGELFLQDAHLRQHYRQRKVAIASPYFTLIPSRLYNADEKNAYLQHVSAALEAGNEVRSDDVRQLSVTNVYAVPHKIFDHIGKYLPESKIFHITTALLMGLLAHRTLSQQKSVYMHVHAGKLILVLLDGTSLQFINIFAYQSAKDFLYYVMLVFDQFKLDPEEAATYISGTLIKESEIYPLLHRYIRQLHFLPAPDFVQWGTKLKAQPSHFFFDLFSISLCN